jgi:hypothetical protein
MNEDTVSKDVEAPASTSVCRFQTHCKSKRSFDILSFVVVETGASTSFHCVVEAGAFDVLSCVVNKKENATYRNKNK